MKKLETLLFLALAPICILGAQQQCYAVTCDTLEGKCTEKSELELKIILSANCQRLQFCDVNDEFSGVCKTKNYYIDPQPLYPNDPCKSGNFKTACAYGLQQCGDDGTCLSVGHDGLCSQSADCPTYQYCNMGVCTNFKKIGDPCFHRNECGRSGTCFYNDSTSIYGFCTQYMKIPDDSPINVKMKIDSYSVINEDSHLLCQSQYADSFGYCKSGLKSSKKGQVCEIEDDCPADDSTSFAKCNCGWNSDKTKYCDLLPGDDEWVDVRSKFQEYFDATRENCNTDARWQECGQPALYNSWMCAKLKAENYALMIDANNLECMDNLFRYLPVFDDIYYYCEVMSLLLQTLSQQNLLSCGPTPKTFNQTYGSFDMRSPVYKTLLGSSSSLQKIGSTFEQTHMTKKQMENLAIQFSDLREIPPKKYTGPTILKPFENRKMVQYPTDMVVNEDYQRVMKEYQIIEQQDKQKRRKNSIHGIKNVSPIKVHQKQNSLSHSKEIPQSILLNIDKIINIQLRKQFNQEMIQNLLLTAKESIKKQNKDPEVQNVEDNNTEDNDKNKSQQESESTEQEQIDDCEIWNFKQQIKEKLRKQLISEAQKAINEQHQVLLKESEKQKEQRLQMYEEWIVKKDLQKIIKEQWKIRIEEQSKLVKDIKQLQNKEAYMKWLYNHAQKLQKLKLKEQREKEIQKIQQQKQDLARFRRKQMAEQSFDLWVKQKRRQSLQQQRQSQDMFGNGFCKQSRMSSINRGSAVNLKIIHKDKNFYMLSSKYSQGDQNNWASPAKQSSQNKRANKFMTSPQLVEKKQVSTVKKRKGGSKKKKFSVNRNQMSYRQNEDGRFIDRISEEQSSSGEASYKKDISSIQRNNQSQPGDNNTGESMTIYGMEAQQRNYD